MQKLYSEFIGMPVFDEYSNIPLAIVRDILIDPENGNILAFFVGKNHIIVPLDIHRITNGIFIADRDRILSINEVVRVQQVYQKNISLIGSKVITEATNVYLGRLVDYEIETTSMILTKLHAAKLFLFFRFQEKIISRKHVVRIERGTIIVKDINAVVLKQKLQARSEAFAA